MTTRQCEAILRLRHERFVPRQCGQTVGLFPLIGEDGQTHWTCTVEGHGTMVRRNIGPELTCPTCGKRGATREHLGVCEDRRMDAAHEAAMAEMQEWEDAEAAGEAESLTRPLAPLASPSPQLVSYWERGT